MRRVANIMGMMISLEILDCKDQKTFNSVFRLFKDIDQRFSPFKADSELTLYRHGNIDQRQLSPAMKKIIESCEAASKKTEGYFSAWAGGQFDPTGYVKGWALELASKLIKAQGYSNFCISAGGDINARGSKLWSIGLQSPFDRRAIMARIKVRNSAVATSGSYERGAHIINPKTKRAAKQFVGLTVVGPSIVEADMLATAAFAMGKKGINFINRQSGYEALAVTPDKKLHMSANMQDYLA